MSNKIQVEKLLVGSQDGFGGWVGGGWMDGWIDGWMGVKPGLRDCLGQSNKIKSILYLCLFTMAPDILTL
jgi:hypothetical protein